MDELQISGKRYISSRRVAKENGYHTDYIGQLIRAGKVKGQKVGRTWYVEATSFAAYLGQPDAIPTTATPAKIEEAPVPAPVVEEAVAEEEAAPAPAPVEVVPVATIAVAPGYIPSAPLTPKVAPVTVHAQPVVRVEEKKVEVSAPIASVAHEADEETFSVPLRKVSTNAGTGGLRYVTEEPSLPEIVRNEAVTRIATTATREDEPQVLPEPAPPERRRNPTRALMLMGGIAVAVFVFSALVSSGLLQTINIEQGNPASVGYVLHW